MTIRHLVLLFCLLFFSIDISWSQSRENYSFLVAGHSYGAHNGDNIGLHPPLLKKLNEEITDDVFAIFLTGDIVNESTRESWGQVKQELNELGIPSYYVMGNHDSNSEGYSVFDEKHGGTYYCFYHNNDLFIVLNSTKDERSISDDQLQFLSSTLALAPETLSKVFIFFHELLWNSDVKYKDLMSNSRSRYAQIIGYSNFWTSVFPIIESYPYNDFFIIAGDVGGNTDAISAFYDQRGNVTFLASGMGEVADENILKADVFSDTVLFKFIPLNENLIMNDASFYNIPANPGKISGPEYLSGGDNNVEYEVEPVFNATKYRWILPHGIRGESNTSSIVVSVDNDFTFDTIAVCAVNEGYCESPVSKLVVKAHFPESVFSIQKKSSFDVDLQKNNNGFSILITSEKNQILTYSFIDFRGKLVKKHETTVNIGRNEMKIGLTERNEPLLLFVTNGHEIAITKLVIN